MAHSAATRENIRTTSKRLTWAQEQDLIEKKGRLKTKEHAKRQAITEAMEARGLTYRDR